MKKIVISLLAALLLTSCGVGTYNISSGKPDECYISFASVSKKPIPIVVNIDGKEYSVSTANEKAYRNDRNIKQTALNTITLAPGAHDVKVSVDGNEVYSKKLFISTSEHKIVQL